MIGTIYLADLRVRCLVGILPHERERAQEILVDVELDRDFAEAARREDVSATVDYAAVAAELASWIAAQRAQLIETLAVRACDMLLARWPEVTRARVCIKKPAAVAAARHAAVAFERRRQP
jgi:dihydroneopterin aldolase